MADLFAWLISLFLTISLFCIVFYQLLCFADLEHEYINQYDSTLRINKVVLPEFVAQGVLCILHLISGHWVTSLLCVPFAYYNVTIYSRGRHLVDVTEIFNQLPWEKKIRLYKLGHLLILMVLTMTMMIWSVIVVDE